MTSEFFGPLPPSDFNQDAMVRWLDQQVVSFQKIITGSLQADNILSSSNYVPGVSGWMIDGDGNAEFNDVEVRGDIISSNWDGAIPANLASFDSDATEGFYLDSSAGAAQFMGPVRFGGESNARFEFLKVGTAPRLELYTSAAVLAGIMQASGNAFLLKGPASGLVLEGDDAFIDLLDSKITFLTSESAVVRATISDTSLSLKVPALLNDGSVSDPALSFTDDTNTGIYRAGGDLLSIAAGGTEVARFGASGSFVRFNAEGSRWGLWDDGAGSTIDAYVRTHTVLGNDYIYLRRGGNPATIMGIVVGNFDTPAVTLDASGKVFIDGTSRPQYTHQDDTDTGIGLAANNIVEIWAANGVRAYVTNGGSGSSLVLQDGLTDVGNHETLRLNRGTGTTLQAVGYFSSWEFDPDTGERRKDDIVSLADSPRWNRDWFYKIRPVDFRRLSTGEREFGFLLDEWKATADDMKYLTTKGDQWGGSPHETALLAATILEVQDHEARLRALEQRLAA